ncbi:DUF1264-domain-containing protein [Xylaria sp. CBS 124048]|nr:DUF1264-domain-containing protein [Xylaria sp. CBS 124048]
MQAGSEKTSNLPGDSIPAKEKALQAGAALVQNFDPPKQVCAHLNGFHTYADELGRYVETNHYCAQLTEGVRQCLLYDSHGPGARLIGIEYMISPKEFETLPQEEKKLWHSHVHEVKSGMLVMPGPTAPGLLQAWETAETEEMKSVISLYGKVYHLWQTDRGDKLPIGEPKLMTSFTANGQLDEAVVQDRDKRFGTDFRRKMELRDKIEAPKIDENVDAAWKAKEKST